MTATSELVVPKSTPMAALHADFEDLAARNEPEPRGAACLFLVPVTCNMRSIRHIA
jgi:hypothetical protein